MRILVLGGHGFVGRHVVEHLSRAGHEAVARSRRDGADLADFASAQRAIRDAAPDAVVNCAAVVGSLNYVTEQAADVADANLRILVNLYRAVVEFSPNTLLINPVANCVFPGHLLHYREEQVWDGPVHNSVVSYGGTRRMMLALSECYRMQYGLRTVDLFVPNMYGPYDSTDPNKAHALNALAAKFVKAVFERAETVTVWGSGVAVREWLYAADFATVVRKVIDSESAWPVASPTNVAQNAGWSVAQIVERIAAHTKFPGRIVWDRSKPDGAPRKVMDDTQFRKAFPGFAFTDFSEGIQATIDYYRSIYPYPSSLNSGVVKS